MYYSAWPSMHLFAVVIQLLHILHKVLRQFARNLMFIINHVTTLTIIDNCPCKSHECITLHGNLKESNKIAKQHLVQWHHNRLTITVTIKFRINLLPNLQILCTIRLNTFTSVYIQMTLERHYFLYFHTSAYAYRNMWFTCS